MASIRGTFPAVRTAAELCGDPSHTRLEYPGVEEVSYARSIFYSPKHTLTLRHRRKYCRMERVVMRKDDGTTQTIHKDGKFARELAAKKVSVSPNTAL